MQKYRKYTQQSIHNISENITSNNSNNKNKNKLTIFGENINILQKMQYKIKKKMYHFEK